MSHEVPHEQRRLLTTGELGAFLGISLGSVYALVRRGMPHLRLGPGARAELRFVRREVLAWLRACATSNAVEELRAGTDRADLVFRERAICRG